MNAHHNSACNANTPAEDALLPVQAAEGDRLGQLQLTPEDLAALKRQGWIQKEWRGNTCIHKLRFRRNGKQVVRYLGDAETARQVADELAVLQAVSRTSRQLARLTKLARKTLRESKKSFMPHLDRVGYRYHGLDIRRRRIPKDGPPNNAPITN